MYFTPITQYITRYYATTMFFVSTAAFTVFGVRSGSHTTTYAPMNGLSCLYEGRIAQVFTRSTDWEVFGVLKCMTLDSFKSTKLNKSVSFHKLIELAFCFCYLLLWFGSVAKSYTNIILRAHYIKCIKYLITLSNILTSNKIDLFFRNTNFGNVLPESFCQI